MREDRKNNEIRNIKITPNYLINAQGSVLIEMGNTKVICTAMVEDKVPFFLKGKGAGWVTAEYSMLPASTHTRKNRDSSRGKIDGRSQEIQRLIGRSLRSVIDLEKIGERTIWIDCDVIQADGGTRTASISGSFVALYLAIHRLMNDGEIEENPINSFLSAISVGIVGEDILLDLCYDEDSNARVDMNIVMDEELNIIEIQGTGETGTFTRAQLNEMLDYSEKGISEIVAEQQKVLKELGVII